MNIQQITDDILGGSSTRAILDLTESSQLRWYNFGRKVDAVMKTGGVMAAAAAPIMMGFSQLSMINSQLAHDKGFKDSIEAGKTMEDHIKGLPETERADFIKSSLGAAFTNMQKHKKSAANTIFTSLVLSLTSLGVGMAGSAGVFTKLGLLVDQRKFKKNLKAGVVHLLSSADPMHRNEVSAMVHPLIAMDPFEPRNSERYKHQLMALSHRLRSYNDPRYSHHITSIDRFVEVLP